MNNKIHSENYDVTIPQVKIVTNNPDQFQKAHKTDAGYDILSEEEILVKAKSRQVISTGLKVSIPKFYAGIIKSRSGLAVKHGIHVGAGIIDCGYTGEIKVLLYNHSDEHYLVKPGDKIAQMLIMPIFVGPVYLVESLEDTERGENGFNSTGYK